MESELWTQLHRRQRGDEFRWRAQAIRDVRRLAGKHALCGAAWKEPLFHCVSWLVFSCCIDPALPEADPANSWANICSGRGWLTCPAIYFCLASYTNLAVADTVAPAV